MKKEKHSVDIYVCEKCGREFEHKIECTVHEENCHKVVHYTATLIDLVFNNRVESVIEPESPKTINIDCPVAKEKLNANAISSQTTQFDMYFDVENYTQTARLISSRKPY